MHPNGDISFLSIIWHRAYGGIETHDMNATYKDAIGQVREVVSIRQTFSRGLQES